ncbi:glycine cleavage system protein R [Luteolibacter luteus]|uniref:Glycine cleavage system protein R n=1 Tax=Luteolibacter luteus TaxID=2728835 RepID=A0A858RLT3_9BACT|nr:ACT domain-containing protein [Luteolibacter luteus]QJE97339.1 glycine cleavage system protein R [Luteolibacter luteus]
MNASVVMTVLAADRPGLVAALSETIAAHGGSWQESRMAHLAGQFAGILRVECPASHVDGLLGDLATLESQGISVQARREEAASGPARETLSLDIVGNDRPGIIRALSAAIAGAGGNVEDLSTSLESAPMAGHPIFHAQGLVSLAADADPAALIAAIEQLGPDLSVSIDR